MHPPWKRSYLLLTIRGRGSLNPSSRGVGFSQCTRKQITETKVVSAVMAVDDYGYANIERRSGFAEKRTFDVPLQDLS